MTKIPYLILTGLFLLALVSFPALAVVNKISPGDTIFIGEKGLDLTGFIDGPVMIGWYAEPCNPSNMPEEDVVKPVHIGGISGTSSSGRSAGGCVPPDDEPPSDIQKIENPADFFVIPDNFIGKLGKWYLWDGEIHGDLAFIVEEPSLTLKILDEKTGKDISGKSIPQGNVVNFLIETNMGDVTGREGYTSDDGFHTIFLKQGKNGDLISELPGKDNTIISLSQLSVDSDKWYWVGLNGDHTKSALGDGWNTGDTSILPGEYRVWVQCDLNGIIDNYTAPDGSAYTGKTASSVKTIEINGEKKVASRPTYPPGVPIYGGQTVNPPSGLGVTGTSN